MLTATLKAQDERSRLLEDLRAGARAGSEDDHVRAARRAGAQLEIEVPRRGDINAEAARAWVWTGTGPADTGVERQTRGVELGGRGEGEGCEEQVLGETMMLA